MSTDPIHKSYTLFMTVLGDNSENCHNAPVGALAQVITLQSPDKHCGLCKLLQPGLMQLININC